MKLRLVLFSSCTLLFSSLSSLSLNAQQEREARLRVTTSLPTLAANGAKPEFGPNVRNFDPAMPSQAIQKQIDAVYSTQEHNEFGQQRNALLFLPGNYSVDVPVGFYTEVMGLGASPDATRIAGNVHADANHEHNNATTTFWRAVEGLSIKPAAARCSGRSRRQCRCGACTYAATWCCTRIMAGQAGAGCRIRWWTGMLTPAASSSGSRATATGRVGRVRTGTWCLSAWCIPRKAHGPR